MKTFFAATAAVALVGSFAVAACTSDDSQPAAATVLANVPLNGDCTQTVECADGLLCGFPLVGSLAACPAQPVTTGKCVSKGPCSIQTLCPCAGGPAFSDCVDQASSGNYATVSAATCSGTDAGGSGDASVADGASDAGDASADAHVDAPLDSATDAGLDSAVDAAQDSGEDASDAAHD